MKNRSKTWLILAIFMTLIIWMNSMFSAEISSNQSGFVTNIVNTLLTFFKINISLDYLSNFIRTFAHFTEFFLLAILWGYYLREKKISIVWIFVIIFMTALFDESIQLFSDGRAFQVFDLMIDNLGGLFGIIFHLGLIKIKKNN